MQNETNRMSLEVVKTIVGTYSGSRRKSVVIGMHFVYLSLKQIGTADVYSSPSSGPATSSNILLQTVDNVSDSDVFDLPLNHVLTLSSVYDT